MNQKPVSFGNELSRNIARILVVVLIPLLTLGVMIAGFRFLRDSKAPKLVIVVVAIVWGVGGVILLYAAATGSSSNCRAGTPDDSTLHLCRSRDGHPGPATCLCRRCSPCTTAFWIGTAGSS